MDKLILFPVSEMAVYPADNTTTIYCDSSANMDMLNRNLQYAREARFKKIKPCTLHHKYAEC